MIIKFVRKIDPTEKQPLIVNTEYNEKSFTHKFANGETLEVEDQLGYQIMSLYPALFEQQAANYKTKTMQPEIK